MISIPEGENSIITIITIITLVTIITIMTIMTIITIIIIIIIIITVCIEEKYATGWCGWLLVLCGVWRRYLKGLL
jgi:uncharacterized membrane protein